MRNDKKMMKRLHDLLPDIEEWLHQPDAPGTLCVVKREKRTNAPELLFVVSVEAPHIESVESYFEMMKAAEEGDES